MTCKDCIHNGICVWTKIKANEMKNCKDFKNKADFVEVVRCKNCQRATKYKDYYLCGIDNRETNAEGFCSYVEKKTYNERRDAE